MTSACEKLEIHLQPQEPHDLNRLWDEILSLLDDPVSLWNLAYAGYGKTCTIIIHTTLPDKPAPGMPLKLPRLRIIAFCGDPGELRGFLNVLREVKVKFFVAEAL